MDFRSDNVAGAAPQVIDALSRGLAGTAAAYGDDPVTGRLVERLAALFEHPVAVYPVATGTAANALALASLVPPYGAIYCHRESHIEADECGAPEFYTGGAKLVLLDGADGKIAADTLSGRLATAGAGVVHHVQPAAVSLTQATECGTVYTPDEVAAIATTAHAHGLPVHMDGARFANALVHLGCTPAEMTWQAGVDVLCLGATKGGCLAAEAVVVFDPERAAALPFRRKRAGHLLSKGRVLSLQLDAWLTDGLWLDLAAHANAQATRLSEGLARIPGITVVRPTQANEVFARLPAATIAGLRDAGYQFHIWSELGFSGWPDNTVRLVTSFATDPADVTGLLHTAAALAGRAAE